MKHQRVYSTYYGIECLNRLMSSSHNCSSSALWLMPMRVIIDDNIKPLNCAKFHFYKYQTFWQMRHSIHVQK